MTSFAEWASTADAVRATSKKLEKHAVLASYLRSLDDEDLVLAARLLAGAPFPRRDERVLSVGGAALADVLLERALQLQGDRILDLGFDHVAVRAAGGEASLQAGDRVGGASQVFLRLVAILPRIVGRVVETHPVRPGLDQCRTPARPRPVDRVTAGGVHGEEVVAVDKGAGDAVTASTSSERSFGTSVPSAASTPKVPLPASGTQA